MRFTFKTLGYQGDAVDSIIRVFEGQEYSDGVRHRHDFGNEKTRQIKIDIETGPPLEDFGMAYRNSELTIGND